MALNVSDYALAPIPVVMAPASLGAVLLGHASPVSVVLAVPKRQFLDPNSIVFLLLATGIVMVGTWWSAEDERADAAAADAAANARTPLTSTVRAGRVMWLGCPRFLQHDADGGPECGCRRAATAAAGHVYHPERLCLFNLRIGVPRGHVFLVQGTL